jgi:hypothetical protein
VIAIDILPLRGCLLPAASCLRSISGNAKTRKCAHQKSAKSVVGVGTFDEHFFHISGRKIDGVAESGSAATL